MHSANLYHVPAHDAGPWGPHGKVLPSWQGAHGMVYGAEGTHEVWQRKESDCEERKEGGWVSLRTSQRSGRQTFGPPWEQHPLAVGMRLHVSLPPSSPPFPLVCLSSFLSVASLDL